MHKDRHHNRGFTLLELAIVVTIIGFIVGSIFAAQSMIRSTQLQNMIGEYDAYAKAVKEFQDKFLALPGDMNNAQGMWGTDPGGCPAAATTTPHVGTCNGDGNGTIGSSDTSGNLSNSSEWFRAWQQLYDAGFVSTEFTGTAGSGGAMEAVPGQNVPKSAALGAGWTILYYSLTTTNANLWGDQYGHILTLGNFSAANITQGATFSSSEALAIDQKIDDGNPGMGIVRAWRSPVLPGCTTDTGTQASQVYTNTGSSAKVCALIFLTRM